MDFVVVGLGLGALAILSGVVLLGVLAGRSRRAAARAASPAEAAYSHGVADGHSASGQGLLWAGGAILLATVGALAGSLDDRTGTLLVSTTATVAALGLLLRAYLYRARNPRPRRPRPAPALASPQAAEPSRVLPLQGDLEPASTVAAGEPETAPAEGIAALNEQTASQSDPVPAGWIDPEQDATQPSQYSFMRNDAPEAEARKAPYSFMLDAGDEAGAVAPTQEAEVPELHPTDPQAEVATDASDTEDNPGRGTR